MNYVMNTNSLVKVYNNIQFISSPKLDKLQWYIYVILNNNGDIKIGRSHDIISRIRSLSNSNAGGSHIVKVAVSPPTYLRTYEGSLHDLYNKYRVPNSEWFKGLDFDIRNGLHNNFIDIIIPYENDLNRYIEHKCTNISNLIYKQIRNIVLRNNFVERCDMIDNDDIIGKYESTIAKYGYWIYFNK